MTTHTTVLRHPLFDPSSTFSRLQASGDASLKMQGYFHCTAARADRMRYPQKLSSDRSEEERRRLACRLQNVSACLDGHALSLEVLDALAAPAAIIVATEPQATRQPPGSFGKRGDVYRSFGQIEEALSYHRHALERAERLQGAQPQRIDPGHDLALACERLGEAHRLLGQTEQALSYSRRALENAERLHAAEPQTADLARELSTAWERLGDVYRDSVQYRQAPDCYRRTVEIRERLLAAQPQRADLARDLAISCHKLGEICDIVGQGDQALQYSRRAREIRERLRAAEPSGASQPGEQLAGLAQFCLVREADDSLSVGLLLQFTEAPRLQGRFLCRAFLFEPEVIARLEGLVGGSYLDAFDHDVIANNLDVARILSVLSLDGEWSSGEDEVRFRRLGISGGYDLFPPRVEEPLRVVAVLHATCQGSGDC
jgi:tetratricopeptide (TPR) repeat protein